VEHNSTGHRRKREDNIKMDLQGTEGEDVDCIHVTIKQMKRDGRHMYNVWGRIAHNYTRKS